jgi:predicted CXXCH cytochrome family protein
MESYRIPTNQFSLYESSIHGQKLLKEGDLAAPTCNNCHGNHGAAPPGLTSVSNSCGECHANNLEYFNQSPHKAAFADMDVGECDACHGHHDVARTADTLLGVGSDATCVTCHDEGDPGYEIAASMATGFDSLKAVLAHARELLERAERGGVNVSLGKFDLHAADDALIKARTSVHYFDSSKFNPIITAGLFDAGKVIELGEHAMWDLKLRQIGLGFTLPLVLLVAFALYMKIRQIERRKPIP